MATLMENEVFKAFASYAAIVTLKMMLMGPLTSYFRFTRGFQLKVRSPIFLMLVLGFLACRYKILKYVDMSSLFQSFVNEEDVARKTDQEKKKLLKAHPDVERAQRCHHNDLENIIPFFFIGLLYALSGPNLSIALIHFRVFTASRIFHSFAYILAFPQPSRALSYLLGMLTTFSMAFNLLITVFVL